MIRRGPMNVRALPVGRDITRLTGAARERVPAPTTYEVLPPDPLLREKLAKLVSPTGARLLQFVVFFEGY